MFVNRQWLAKLSAIFYLIFQFVIYLYYLELIIGKSTETAFILIKVHDVFYFILFLFVSFKMISCYNTLKKT